MKVTFDTNVWQKVVLPDNYATEPDYSAYKKINEGIKTGNIEAFLSATIFTIEGVDRKDRAKFVKDDKPNIKFVHGDGSGKITLQISISSNMELHPGVNSIAKQHLVEAEKLKFRILELPRLGGIHNPDIQTMLFDMTDDQHKLLFEVTERIEQNKCGEYHAMELGLKYDPNAWYQGLRKAPESEAKQIAKVLAEWADGDSVACHIAVGADYFCTNDKAKGAGQKSVLSAVNVAWLKADYNFQTVTPSELATLLK